MSFKIMTLARLQLHQEPSMAWTGGNPVALPYLQGCRKWAVGHTGLGLNGVQVRGRSNEFHNLLEVKVTHDPDY